MTPAAAAGFLRSPVPTPAAAAGFLRPPVPTPAAAAAAASRLSPPVPPPAAAADLRMDGHEAGPPRLRPLPDDLVCVEPPFEGGAAPCPVDLLRPDTDRIATHMDAWDNVMFG